MSMTLTRSSTGRSKSRSPALSSNSPSPLPFPASSHHATAVHSSSRRANTPQNISPTSPAHHCSSPPFSQAESPQSDSSFEFKPAGDFRFGVLGSGQQPMLARRKSQLGDLSQLEAQLLPSLRDTIDRMTRPPSRATCSTAKLHSSNFDLHPVESSHRGSPSFSSFSTTTTSSASLSPHPFPQPSFLLARSSSASTAHDKSLFSSHHHSAPSSPTRTLSAIPKFATKHKPQSTLKAMSRPPIKTSPAPSSSSRSPSPAKVAIVMGTSVQAPISPHATVRETEDKAELPKSMDKSKVVVKGRISDTFSTRIGRSRSRTDPGSTSENPSLVSPLVPSTPNMTKNKHSNIPRPTLNPPVTSGRNPQNAHASSNSWKPSQELTSMRAPVTSHIQEESDSARSLSEVAGGISPERGRSPSSRVRARSRWQTSTSRQLSTRIESGLGLTETRENIVPVRDVRRSSIQERRRMALLGIVDGLALNLGPMTGRTNAAEEEEGSDYSGQEGLAISGCEDIAFYGVEGGLEDRSASESGALPDFLVTDGQEDTFLTPHLVGANSGDGSAMSGVFQSALADNWSYNARHDEDPPKVNPISKPLSPELRETSFDGSQQSLLNLHSDAASVLEESYAAASKERKALGIPPSVSDYFTGGSGGNLTHSESDLSSAGSLLWSHGDIEASGLSKGAETLFDSLWERRRSQSDCGNRHDTKQSAARVMEWHLDAQRRFSDASRRSSASVYEDNLLDVSYQTQSTLPAPAEERPLGSTEVKWKERFSEHEYTELLQKNDVTEMKRQEFIWRLHVTEDAFVHRLHCVVTLFILPLRVRNQRTWIAGIPAEVARLFDWLEDIVNLHDHILTVLRRLYSKEHPLVWNVATELRRVIPRFEVYQPFLVRLEEVTDLIKDFKRDKRNLFGEFVRIQEADPLCEGRELEQSLLEPLDRLASYPAIFRDLLAVTPKTHSDYLATLSLLHSTEMMIRVMVEVKTREVEYRLIKNLSTSIHGLPSSVQLAGRERRLLLHGPVYHVTFEHSADKTSRNDCFPPPRLNGNQRSSRLIDAIIERTQPIRQESIRSKSSLSMVSFKSHENASSISSSDFPIVSSPKNCFPPRLRQACLNRSKALLHAFIFADLLVLTTPILARVSDNLSEQEWCLWNHMGLSRVLDVTEQTHDGNYIISLDLLPVGINDIQSGAICDTAMVTSVQLIPIEGVIGGPSGCEHPALQRWLWAFKQSAQHTLRSLSCPSQSGRYGPNFELESDMAKSTTSAVAMGLPLPKSPSVQSEEAAYGGEKDPTRQEREERSWWSFRFQQVLCELQRQSVVRLDDR